MGLSCVASNICGLSGVSDESTTPRVKRGDVPLAFDTDPLSSLRF